MNTSRFALTGHAGIAVLLMLLVMVLLVPVMPGQAQDAGDEALSPLYIAIDGHVNQYDPATGAWSRLTSDDMWDNPQIAVSPDSSLLAYTTYAREFITFIENNGGRSGAPAEDVYLMDMATNETTVIAMQPDDADMMSNFISRSQPYFSLNLPVVVWSEYHDTPDGDMYFAGVHDLETGETRTFPLNMENVYGIPTAPRIAFVDDTLAILLDVYNEDVQSGEAVISLFDLEGNLSGALRGTETDWPFPDDASTVEWLLTDDGTWILGVQSYEGNWQALDAQTAEILPDIVPVNPPYTLPDSAFPAMYYDPGADVEWTLQPEPGSDLIPLTSEGMASIAPNGQAIAYLDDEDSSLLHIWQPEGIIAVPLAAQFSGNPVWSFMIRRVE